MVQKGLSIPRDKRAAFCRRNHIRKLFLFGSVLRQDFGQESELQHTPDSTEVQYEIR